MIKYLLTVAAIAIVLFLLLGLVIVPTNTELSSKVESNKARIIQQHDCILEIQAVLIEIKTLAEDRDILFKQAEIIQVLTTKIEQQDAILKAVIERATEIQRVNRELQAALIKANRKK